MKIGDILTHKKVDSRIRIRSERKLIQGIDGCMVSVLSENGRPMILPAHEFENWEVEE